MFNTDMVNTREFNESPHLRLSLSDSLGIAESLSRVSQWYRTIADNLTVQDVFSRIWGGHLLIQDNLTVSDSIISKVFNRLASAPRILGAIVQRFRGGSAIVSKPKENV